MGTHGKISHGTAGRFATRREVENVCLFAGFEVLVDSMVGDLLVGETNLAYRSTVYVFLQSKLSMAAYLEAMNTEHSKFNTKHRTLNTQINYIIIS